MADHATERLFGKEVYLQFEGERKSKASILNTSIMAGDNKFIKNIMNQKSLWFVSNAR